MSRKYIVCVGVIFALFSVESQAKKKHYWHHAEYGKVKYSHKVLKADNASCEAVAYETPIEVEGVLYDNHKAVSKKLMDHEMAQLRAGEGLYRTSIYLTIPKIEWFGGRRDLESEKMAAENMRRKYGVQSAI